MVLLFTDFGSQGPYLGQMEFVLGAQAPDVKVINLVSDAPPGNPRHSAYFLASLATFFPAESVFLCVVDPGVGGKRLPVVLRADGRWFVGPDNGLLYTVARHAKAIQWWEIAWRPQKLSASFHGRDLFAPIAAQIASRKELSGLKEWGGPDIADWMDDLCEVIYIDHYGNLITGLRYGQNYAGKSLVIKGHKLSQSDTFCSVSEGQTFWYANSSGLIEIAMNQGRADKHMGLSVGDKFQIL